MPTIATESTTLFYRLSQNDLAGRRPSLLLIHGAGGTHMHWPAQLRRLPDWNVFSLDLPGHGHSPGPGRDTIAGYRDAILAFCQALGLKRVVLAGHSMGGAVAMDFALRFPQRLAGLILVATGARLRVDPAILDGIDRDFAGVARLLAERAHGSHPPEQLMRLYLRRMLDNDPAVVHGDFAACNAFDVRADLPRMAVPALVIGGTADRLTPPRYAEYLAENIPDSRLHLVPDAGHMVMLEAADEVAEAAEAFLRIIADDRWLVTSGQ